MGRYCESMERAKPNKLILARMWPVVSSRVLGWPVGALGRVEWADWRGVAGWSSSTLDRGADDGMVNLMVMKNGRNLVLWEFQLLSCLIYDRGHQLGSFQALFLP